MPYNKEPRRITAGGLNLLPPSDLVQNPDSLILQNWRPDQAGALVSRKGMTRYATGLGGAVHSLFRFGNDRLGGVGSALRSGPALAASLETGFDGEPLFFAAHQDFSWVMNRGKAVKVSGATAHAFVPAAPTGKIAASAGAYRTTVFADFEDPELWDLTHWAGGVGTPEPAAERAITSDGTVSATNGNNTLIGLGTAWTPDMVGKNIVIQGDGVAILSTVVDSVVSATELTFQGPWPYTSGSGKTYTISETVVTKSYDTVNKLSGAASLSINAYRAGGWQVDQVFPAPKDTKVEGVAAKADRFQWALYCENPQAVTAITVTMFSEAGGLTQTATALVNPALLVPVNYTWSPISISRGLDALAYANNNPEFQEFTRLMDEALAAGNDVYYGQLRDGRQALYDVLIAKAPHFNATQEFDWSAVTRVWIRVEVSQPGYLGFDNASFLGALPGALKGEYSFFLTFDNANGHESNGGAESDAVVFDYQQVSLSAIPVSPDPQVTRRHVYLMGGALQVPLRCETIGDNVSTARELSVDIDAVLANNIEIPFDHDPPPAARGICGPYGGRLIAWSTAEHPARMFYSPVGKPFAWPGADDDADGNWEDVGDAKEELLCVIPHPRMLAYYKEGSVWRTIGDPDASSPERTSVNVPVFGPKAVAAAGSYDYFAGAKGMFRFNGDGAQLVSGKVQPIFEGQYVELPDGTFAVPVNLDAPRSSFVMEYRAGRVYFSYPEVGSTLPNQCLVYEEAGERWHTFKTAAGGLTALHFERAGSENGLYGGTAGGELYQMESGTTDNGAAIEVIWETRSDDFGLPDQDKVVAELALVGRTADNGEMPSTLTVKVVPEDGNEVTLGTFSAADRTTQLFKLGVKGLGLELLRAALRVEGSISSTVRIFQSYWRWYPLDQAGLTFDTGIINFGSGKVKEIDEVVLDVTPVGNTVSWAVMSDLPGNVLTERETASKTVTAGARQVVRIPFSALRNGVNWRFHAWSDQAMQVHGVSFRARTIGLFVDGAAGETWESQADSVFAHQFVYLLREIEFLVDVDGTMTGRVSVELPGREMREVKAAPLNTDVTSTGKLPIRVRLPGNTKGQLRRVRIDGAGTAKVYGIRVYAKQLGSATNWQWYDVPVVGSDREWSMAQVS